MGICTLLVRHQTQGNGVSWQLSTGWCKKKVAKKFNRDNLTSWFSRNVLITSSTVLLFLFRFVSVLIKVMLKLNIPRYSVRRVFGVLDVISKPMVFISISPQRCSEMVNKMPDRMEFTNICFSLVNTFKTCFS